MSQPQSVVAIAIATVIEPKRHRDGDPLRRLVGVGLFHFVEHADGDFAYSLSARTAPAGTGEATLIDWLIEHLPTDATVIGWQLADDIVPALFAAADEASPNDARVFIDALAHAVGRGTVDLADDYGGVAAPQFEQVCAAANIVTAPIASVDLLAAWGIGRMEQVAQALGVNAIAAWRLLKVGEEGAGERDRFAADLLHQWRRKARRVPATHDLRHIAAGAWRGSNEDEVPDD